MIDALIYIVLALITVTLSVWITWISVNSSAAQTNKSRHISGFVLLGVLSFGLTATVGIRNWKSQQNAGAQQKNLTQSLQQTTTMLGESNARARQTASQLDESNARAQQTQMDMQFLKGQLNGANLMLGSIKQTGDANSSGLIAAINSIAKNQETVPARYGSPGLRDLTNAELTQRLTRVSAIVGQMETEYETELAAIPPFSPDSSALSSAAHVREASKWSQIQGECDLLVSESLDRIPPAMRPTDRSMLGTAEMVLKSGALAGAYPLRTFRAYLDQLAILLPQAKKKR